MTSYDSTSRTPFKKGGEVKDSRNKRSSKFKALSKKHKWSDGPKPGSLEYFQLVTQKPKKEHHAFKKGGRTNTSRENRLEELGRVDAERAGTRKGKRNLKDEKRRIVRELKK